MALVMMTARMIAPPYFMESSTTGGIVPRPDFSHILSRALNMTN